MATAKPRAAKPRIPTPPKKAERTPLDRNYEDGSKVRVVRGKKIAYDPNTKAWRDVRKHFSTNAYGVPDVVAESGYELVKRLDAKAPTAAKLSAYRTYENSNKFRNKTAMVTKKARRAD